MKPATGNAIFYKLMFSCKLKRDKKIHIKTKLILLS